MHNFGIEPFSELFFSEDTVSPEYGVEDDSGARTEGGDQHGLSSVR